MNSADFTLLAQHYNYAYVVPAGLPGSVVPEPAGAVLGLAASGMLLQRKRNR